MLFVLCSAYRDCRRLQILLSQIECMSVPTFSILNGTALGGGLELALSCQYRIVDQDTNIQLGLPEIRLGVIPGDNESLCLYVCLCVKFNGFRWWWLLPVAQTY